MKTCPKCDAPLELDENNEPYCPNEECPSFMINPDDFLEAEEDTDFSSIGDDVEDEEDETDA